jgi:hypothetical protein
MKLEVIDRSSGKIIAPYVVPAISMLSFQQWKDLSEVVIPLDQLSIEITGLDSSDPETGEPSLIVTPIDFYLPSPLKDGVTERLAKRQMAKNADSSQFPELLLEMKEQASTPPLDVSTILLAVAEEISQNHLPNDAYEVRISDE